MKPQTTQCTYQTTVHVARSTFYSTVGSFEGWLHHDIYIYKNNKNIFNKNEGRCRDVKTPKACEQGWEVNVGPKIKQTTSI